MLRRRVNTPLLLWTIAGAAVLTLVVVLVHGWQYTHNSDALLRRAHLALQQDQPHQAAHYFKLYLSFHPHDTPALIQYGQTLKQIADGPAAEYRAFLVLDQAVRRVPDDATLRKEVAQLAQDLYLFPDAVEHLKALLQAAPKDAGLWLDLGWCQESLNDDNRAEASYRKAIELDAKLLLGYARLGNLLVRQQRSSDVIQLLDEMVTANPGSHDALLARADYLQSVGQEEQARNDIDAAYQAAPKQLGVVLAKARMEQERGQTDKARAALTLGLTHHPASKLLYQALIQLELQADNPAQAGHWLEQILKHDPKDLKTRFQLFDLILAQGEQKQAQKVLDELKELEGEKGSLWRYAEAAMLVTFAGPGNASAQQLARQRLGEARQLQPNWNQPWLLEGLLEERAGNKTLAISHYRKAQTMGTVPATYLYRLANLLYEQRAFAEAAKLMGQIEAHAKLGKDQARLAADVALQLGDLARAAALAHQAVPAAAHDYRDHLWQAKILRLAGYPEKAETVLQKLTQKSPSVPEVWVAFVQQLAAAGKRDQAGLVLKQIPKHLAAVQVKLALARCQEALGELQLAEKLFQENVDHQPEAFLGWKHLAEFYLRQEQYAKAEPWLRELIDPNHRLPPELAQQARRQLAVALARQGDAEKYKEALTLVPKADKSASSEDTAAWALVLATQAGERSRAIQMLVDLHQQQPLSAANTLALAVLHRQEGRPDKANALLQQLLAQEGEQPAYLVEYVRCQVAAQHLGDALLHFKRLQFMQPNHPAIAELQSLLKNAQLSGQQGS